MTPAKLDLIIYRGSTFVKEITWQTGTPATAVNLTGCKIRMQIRPKTADTNIITPDFILYQVAWSEVYPLIRDCNSAERE